MHNSSSILAKWGRNFGAIVTITVGMASQCQAELLENGDFGSDIPHWRVQVHKSFVPKPKISVGDNTFTARQVSELRHHYITLSQAVDIKKDIRYKLSFEVKGPAKGQYRVVLGDSGKAPKRATFHFASKKLTPGTSWETIEEEFVGKFDTDGKWLRKWNKNERSNELKDGRTPRSKDRIIEVDEDDLPYRSKLSFHFGALDGEINLRNVSLIEVTQ